MFELLGSYFKMGRMNEKRGEEEPCYNVHVALLSKITKITLQPNLIKLTLSPNPAGSKCTPYCSNIPKLTKSFKLGIDRFWFNFDMIFSWQLCHVFMFNENPKSSMEFSISSLSSVISISPLKKRAKCVKFRCPKMVSQPFVKLRQFNFGYIFVGIGCRPHTMSKQKHSKSVY